MTATGTSPSKTIRACAASMPACRQLQGQNLATGDAASVAHARELADGESAVLVHQRALGPHAAQRRAFALQITQILGRFIATLDRPAGLKDPLQFYQRRCAALPAHRRPLPAAIRVAQAQRADPAEVIHREQVVQFREGRQSRIVLAAFGVVSGDDAPAPGIGRGVGDSAMEYRIMERGRLV
jgi:hypothetical protein